MAGEVGGQGAGVSGELEGDLLVVAGGEGRVGPGEDGGDERFVRRSAEGESGLDQAARVVDYDVGVGL
ncbi:hypothetical protein [Streptomyces sp. NPDC059247]|uniref:hypothetical protein n=1 Tax=Streptomyces sp. NPDC059247 TaxID=3346790 RepID=UPI00367A4573